LEYMSTISFLGNFGVDYSSESHHVKTLESLGYTVIKLQEGETRSQQVLRCAQSSDLFVYVHTHGWKTTGSMSMDSVLDELYKAGVPTMTYHLDLWFGLRRQVDLEKDNFYKTIGHFFTVDKLMADWFNENTNVKGHFLLPGVYDKECFIDKEYSNDFEHEVIFVGSKGYHPEYPYRPELIDFLRDTYGDGFTHVSGDGDTGTLRGNSLNKIYAKSKIAVGDTLNLGFKYPYYTSDRLFESTGRGGFTIYPGIRGIEDTFVDKKEIVWYDHGNLGDLKEKIDYYLKHDEERESIRLAGHERTKKDHTYVNRWNEIMKELNL